MTRWKLTMGLVVVLVFLRLPALLNPLLDADEAIFAMFARMWFDGGIPYLEFVETKPLGIYFFYGVIFSLFGRFNMIAVHAVTIIVVGATACVIGLMANRLYSERAGFWAALLYIVFGTTYIPKYIATTIEPIMLLPVALQFYLWLRYENEKRTSLAFASGLAFSAACLFKYQAGMNLAVLAIYLGIVKPIIVRDIPYREHWRGFGRFIAGAIPLPLLMLVYLAYIGALDAFWFWNIQGNLEYINEGSSGISLVHQILTRVLPFIGSTILLWVLVFISAIMLFRVTRDARRVTRDAPARQRFGGGRRATVSEWLILLWFILSLVPVCAGRRFYGHYFILLLPPMAILGSRVQDVLWSAKGRRWIKAVAVFWVIVPALGFFTARFFISDIHRMAHEDNLDDYKPLAEYVALHTQPEERIAVWGNAPAIYWYSRRLPATRFFWSDLQSGRVRGVMAKPSASAVGIPEAWDMFMDDINRHRPVYIIDTSPAGLHDYQNYPMENHPRLMQYAERNYHIETSVNKAVFYRRNN